MWNGSTWVNNGYNLPVGVGAWVGYQIPSNWVIGGTVSIKYDDDTDGDTTAQSIHIDYCGVRGTTAAPAFDFSISASPDNLSVQQAGSISTTVSVALTSGTAKTVSLSGKWIGTAPGGVTPSFSPSSGTPNFGSILTFSTTAAASTGTFTYQVKGTGGGQTHSTNITLTINEPAFDFSVSASPDILSVQPGSDNTTTVTVTLDAGSTENVTLSGSWIGGTPSGVSTNFTPSSGNPTYDSTLTFTATASASEGNFTYRVSDTDGGVTRYTDITLVVGTPPFDFSVDASPVSLTIWQGDTATSTITTTLVSGSPQTVSLSGDWWGTPPSGVNASFSLSSGTPTYDSVLTFTTTQDASTGTFTYRVTAENDGLSRTKDITLTINEVTFSFSLSASPDNLTLMRSDSTTSTISLNIVVGTAENVSLSGSWVDTAPTGVSAGFSPSFGTPPFSSILTFTTTSTAGAGTFTYRVSGTDGGMTRTDDITVIINTELTLTLETDNENYDKGQTIQISGTATDPKGNTVSSGTATIQLSCGDWGHETTVQISNGAYSDNFHISFGHPEGTWSIEISAADSLGNSGSTSKNIDVTTPAAYAYYTVQIQSPVAGLTYTRGDDIDISVKVTEDGVNVENAEVSLTTPTGGEIAPTETSPGTYTSRYCLEWDDPEGTWSISIEGKKTVDNTFKAGGGYINVEVEPATLQITLLSPTERKFEVGQSITVSAEVSYPDGTLVEDVTVSATTPAGEDLTLAYESPGVYSTNYVVTEQDVGSWTLRVSAEDLYGNSGSKSSVISIEPMGTVGIIATYWWTFLPIIVAAVVVAAFRLKGPSPKKRLKTVLEGKKEVLKLKKEAAVKYFKDGAISRGTYDELMGEYDGRMAKLEEKERALRARMKKKAKKKVKERKKKPKEEVTRLRKIKKRMGRV